MRPLNIFARGTPYAPTSFFLTQSQSSVIKFSSFIFFYHLKSVITNLGWMRKINPYIIWLYFSN